MEQPHIQPVKGLFRLCPWFSPRDVLVDVILLQVALLESRVSVAPPIEGHLPVQYDTYIYRECIRRLGTPGIPTELGAPRILDGFQSGEAAGRPWNSQERAAATPQIHG